jgi:hypothetical protein
MPRTKRAPGKRPRARDTAKSLAKVRGLAVDMEVPLDEAADFVLALRLIGNGLIADYNNDGRAIAAVAWAASQRLDALRDIWDRMFKATASRPARKRATADDEAAN